MRVTAGLGGGDLALLLGFQNTEEKNTSNLALDNNPAVFSWKSLDKNEEIYEIHISDKNGH